MELIWNLSHLGHIPSAVVKLIKGRLKTTVEPVDGLLKTAHVYDKLLKSCTCSESLFFMDWKLITGYKLGIYHIPASPEW